MNKDTYITSLQTSVKLNYEIWEKEVIEGYITYEELCYAVKKMKNDKCPGTGQNPFQSKGAVDKATQSRHTFLLLVVKFWTKGFKPIQ